jgi:nucleoside-diphosphate-sugar epimerase
MTEEARSGVARALDVLVTGSSAEVSGDLVDALRARGHGVRVIDSGHQGLLARAGHVDPLPTDPLTLREAAATADVIVLMVGLGPVSATVEDAAALDVILGAARPGSTLVETSSLAVLGDLDGAPADESVEPRVPAGLESLRAAEVRALAAGDWLRTVVVRAGLVYGPGGGPVLRAALERARETGVSRYAGRADDSYPLVHSADLADLLVRLAEQDTARGVFHAVTARCTAGLLASLVADIAGAARVEPGDAPWLWTPLPLGTPPPRVDHRAVTARADEVGWRPTAPGLGDELNRVPLA